MIYTINNYKIFPENFSIALNNDSISVEPQVFNLIVYLIQNKSRVITRHELIENVWQGRVVLDATLSNHIKTARSILGDDGQAQNVIKTIHGRGYQLIAQVIESHQSSQPNLHSGLSRYKKYFLYAALISSVCVLAFVYYNFQIKQLLDGTIKNKSIAVLAFLDMSPDKDHEYFSDGISEEILNKLAHIPDLRVISRTSSFYFKDKDSTIKEIGKELNVSHVLEGSVRKQGNKIRITVQLIETNTSNHLWSQTYDNNLDNIFKIQDEIAESVSQKLSLSLFQIPSTKIKINSSAYNIYLQAKQIGQNRSSETFKNAELTIKKSIAFDPGFSQSWHYLSYIVFESTISFGMRSLNDGIKISTYATKQSLTLDPNYGPSYAQLSRIQSQQRNFKESKNNIQKALELDSNNAFVIDIAAINAMHAGDLDKSLKHRRQLMDVNPKYSRNHYSIGQLNYLLLNLDTAYQNLNKYLTLMPKSAITHHLISGVLLAQGKNSLALEQAQLETNEFWKQYAMCMAVFANGDIQLADELLNDFIADYSKTDLANIARIYAFRGEKNKSFEWLNKAFELPDSTLLSWLNFPEFKKMHGDPRWGALILKMKLPDSHWLVNKS